MLLETYLSLTPQYTPSLFTIIIKTLLHLEITLKHMLEVNILLFNGIINKIRLRIEQ